MLEQCCKRSQECRNNVVTLWFTKNRRCKPSCITSSWNRRARNFNLRGKNKITPSVFNKLSNYFWMSFLLRSKSIAVSVPCFFFQSDENSQVDLFNRNVVNRFTTKGEMVLFSSYAKKVRQQPWNVLKMKLGDWTKNENPKPGTRGSCYVYTTSDEF